MAEEINEKLNAAPENEGGIDIKAIALRLWAKRRFILYVVAGFTALGLVAAICQKNKYISTCTFVPQFSSPIQASPFYTFSPMPSMESVSAILLGESLSPLVFPQILDNTEFNKELMQVPLHFRKWSEPVCLYDYYNDPKYKEFDFIKTLKKYTVDVPGRLLRKIEPKEPDVVLPEDNDKPMSLYTKKEFDVAKKISEMIKFEIDKKEFYFSLTATAKEALVSAELCQATLDLMQKYITDYKLSHARQNLEHIKGLYDTVKTDYEAKQFALAQYLDSNRGTLTATTQTRKDQLTSDYQIAYAAFSEASKQLLLAEVKVREDTPSFSTVNPVSVPIKKSNSRVKTLLTWIFLGFFFGCGAVVGLDWLKNQGINWPKRWTL